MQKFVVLAQVNNHLTYKRCLTIAYVIGLWAILLILGIANASAQSIKSESKFSDHQFIPLYNLKKVGNPIIFQGNKEKQSYFEGWYYKMVSENAESVISIIPGISLSDDGSKQHAFIQIIDGITAKTSYFSFPIDSFSFSKRAFAIRIGENFFSRDSILLNIQRNDTSIVGRVLMTDVTRYRPRKIFNPGIMGWYRYVPFMECYHGVASLTHKLHGSITMNQTTYTFNKGKGYIEKDWGTSMPTAWIWMQSNSFHSDSSSFMLSIADIPWRGKSFSGFLGFHYHNNRVQTFATYRRSKLSLEISDSNDISINIKEGKYLYVIEAKSNKTGLLKAPVSGSMDRRIPEGIDARIDITIKDKKGQIIYRDSSTVSGLELVGNYREIAKNIK